MDKSTKTAKITKDTRISLRLNNSLDIEIMKIAKSLGKNKNAMYEELLKNGIKEFTN